MKRLKPVTFIQGEFSYYRRNIFQQNLLLKALQVTSDPKKLRDIVGLQSVAEVYRTLDKLVIRKEYHEALARHGLTLDKIAEELRGILDQSKSDKIRLNCLQTLLRSLGLDKYEKQEESMKSWEEILMQISEDKLNKRIEAPKTELKDYEVLKPNTPIEEEKKQIEERTAADELYGDE